MTLFHCKFMTSYLMATVMFPLSLTVCEIFAHTKNAKHFTLKMKVKDEKNIDLCHSTGIVRIHIVDFFSEF